MEIKDIPLIPLDPKIYYKLVSKYGPTITIGKMLKIDPIELLEIEGVGESTLINIDTYLNKLGIKWLKSYGLDHRGRAMKRFVNKYKYRSYSPYHDDAKMSRKLQYVLSRVLKKPVYDLLDVAYIKFIDLAMCRGAGEGMIEEFNNLMMAQGVNWLNNNGFASMEQVHRVLKKRDYFKYNKAFKRTDEDVRKYLESILP